jgi:hypothetical protein
MVKHGSLYHCNLFHALKVRHRLFFGISYMDPREDIFVTIQ